MSSPTEVDKIDSVSKPSVVNAKARLLWDTSIVLCILAFGFAMWRYGSSIWVESDRKFFVILPIACLFFLFRRFHLGLTQNPTRGRVAAVCLGIAGICAALGAIQISPWWFLLATIACVTGWGLARLPNLPWYSVLGAVFPLVLLSLFPTGAQNEWSETFESQATLSASAILDTVGIANFPSVNGLATESGTVQLERMCRGWLSPYLLLSLAGFLLVLSGFRPAVVAIALIITPLISWLMSTSYAMIWLGGGVAARSTPTLELLGAIGLLLAGIGLVFWLTFGISRLLEPFSNYSTGSNSVHKGFNRAVYWPASDPLRSRKSREAPRDEDDPAIDWWSKPFLWTHLCGTLAAIAAGITMILRT